MQCPACDKPMVILEHLEIEVDFCVACRGCWLDPGELELMLGIPANTAPSWSSLTTGGARSPRRCPRCGQPMRVGPFPGTEVEVDVCRRGHGLWLDDGELAAIGKAGGGAAAYFEGLFGPQKPKPEATKESVI